MKTSITAGIKDVDLAKEIKMNFVSSGVIRRRIKELIKTKEEVAYTSSVLESGYDSPNWTFKQADTVGYIRALREVASLLED